MEQHIFLAPESVFPIINDEVGSKLPNQPATGFSIAGTIQGEGKLAGVPVLFIRLAGCNLRCMWSLPNGEVSLCDTPLASFDTSKEKRVSVSTIKSLVINNMNNLHHLVVSGGEPFIQPNALTELIHSIKVERDIHIAVETNGTIYNRALVEQFDFFSISPKLKNSVPTLDKVKKTGVNLPFEPSQAEALRLNIPVVQQFIDHCNQHRQKDFQLKFVVQSLEEIKEIEDSFLAHLTGWKPDDVVLMPLGSDREELNQTRLVALEAAIERGWRFSPRLQVTYFGGISGV